ncbi:MAG: hypothetical protein J7623_16655 [Chitinophaga sp.]|uniref:hypothetical protein n=1 Tax=Chitinophaga sp. TaxID=1869181 RepID=UPI001B23F8CF|nr:hypothetical protein [Chitinophaga sp.]MBO9730273.1 hypothetical protein [Chitinophaga sp.]
MKDKFIRVEGIASKKVEVLLNAKLGTWPIHASSCILFVSYSDFDIPLGETFFYLIDREERDAMYIIQAKLIQVTQSWLKPFDEIPRGHKSICEIKLDDPSLKLLQSKLPVVDGWGENGELKFLLATGNDINLRN